jgi:hypothetical protein
MFYSIASVNVLHIVHHVHVHVNLGKIHFQIVFVLFVHSAFLGPWYFS